jgi:hypothetical protein
MPSMGESKRSRRAGMGAASYFLLAAQILSLGHLLLVRHATCPEHGDVVHSGQPHEELLSRHVLDEGLPSRRSMAGAVPQTESGHDHCLLCTITHERFALLPPAGISAKRIELAVRLVCRSDVSPLAPVAVIVLSPKTSPPSA